MTSFLHLILKLLPLFTAEKILSILWIVCGFVPISQLTSHYLNDESWLLNWLRRKLHLQIRHFEIKDYIFEVELTFCHTLLLKSTECVWVWWVGREEKLCGFCTLLHGEGKPQNKAVRCEMEAKATNVRISEHICLYLLKLAWLFKFVPVYVCI